MNILKAFGWLMKPTHDMNNPNLMHQPKPSVSYVKPVRYPLEPVPEEKKLRKLPPHLIPKKKLREGWY